MCARWIEAQARARGDAVFLIAPDDGEEITFSQLRESAREIGARLDALGVRGGAKVAFLLDNGSWTARLLLGVMASGRVVVPLNTAAGPAHLQHVLSHSDAELVLVAPQHREKLAECPVTTVPASETRAPEWPAARGGAQVRADAPAAQDAALLLYTSGSTGLPKGALLSHAAVMRGGRNAAGGHALGGADRALCVLPLCHINGAMVTAMAPLVQRREAWSCRAASAQAYFGV